MILVPIKRVFDPYATVRPLNDGSALDVTGLRYTINPFDEIALESAIRLKEGGADHEIVVATIGGAECEEVLRKALAMGADRALLIESTARWDSASVAAELAALSAELRPNLILMGKQATDDDCGQVGPMLAGLLDWPQVTFASGVTLDEHEVTVVRETDDGQETVSALMPCVITADLRLNEPRYVSLPGIMRARSKPLAKRDPLTQPRLRTRTVGLAAIPPRPPGRRVSSAMDLIGAWRDQGVGR